MQHEQHFLTDTLAFEMVLDTLPLKGRGIVEIGAGTGALSQLILDRGVESLTAFEIEPGLCRLQDRRFRLIEEDATPAITKPWLKPWFWQGRYLVSAPPYSLLPHLWSAFQDLPGVVLLVPGNEIFNFINRGFHLAATLPGTAFSPVATGEHGIMVKGFAPPELIEHTLLDAFWTRDLERFMSIVFPSTWQGLAARIMESGATMSAVPVPWAPRWTPISPTLRVGTNLMETAVKSILYRAHDALHQLWGLPSPSRAPADPDPRFVDDFYGYKRAQMCGEVAVLTLTEFALAGSLAARFPRLRSMLANRNALPLVDPSGPLYGKSLAQIAARLDGILHKKIRPRWVRESATATAFTNDYVPMLEEDRRLIDHNWALMRDTGWAPEGLPNARYSPNLDGLELTMWMIQDFLHLMDTDPVVDWGLALFNRERRDSASLPEGWNTPLPEGWDAP